MTLKQRIEEKENEDFQIAKKVFKDLLSGCTNVRIEQTDFGTSVDMRVTADSATMDIELKCHAPNNYKHCVLKKEKYERMKKAHINKHLLICYIFGGSDVYIFKLTDEIVNTFKLEKKTYKVTQYDCNSKVEEQWCYFPLKSKAYKHLNYGNDTITNQAK